MPSRRLDDLEPVTRKQVNQLMDIMRTRGYPLRCTCTFRTFAEQDALYAQGRTAPGKIVTKAKAGQSPHNHRMAADFIFINEGYNGPWEVMGAVAQEVGLVWGGSWKSFKDFPHVERKDWKKIVNKV